MELPSLKYVELWSCLAEKIHGRNFFLAETQRRKVVELFVVEMGLEIAD
jgi:hypothetical protein